MKKIFTTLLISISILSQVNAQQKYKKEFIENIEYFTGKKNGKDLNVKLYIINNVVSGNPVLISHVKLEKISNFISYDTKRYTKMDLGSSDFYSVKLESVNIEYDVFSQGELVSTVKMYNLSMSEQLKSLPNWNEVWPGVTSEKTKQIWRIGYDIRNARITKANFNFNDVFNDVVITRNQNNYSEIESRNNNNSTSSNSTNQTNSSSNSKDAFADLDAEEEEVKRVIAENNKRRERINNKKKRILTGKISSLKEIQSERISKYSIEREALERSMANLDIKNSAILKAENLEIEKTENKLAMLSGSVSNNSSSKSTSSGSNSYDEDKYKRLLKKGDAFVKRKLYDKGIKFYEQAKKYTYDTAIVNLRIKSAIKAKRR